MPQRLISLFHFICFDSNHGFGAKELYCKPKERVTHKLTLLTVLTSQLKGLNLGLHLCLAPSLSYASQPSTAFRSSLVHDTAKALPKDTLAHLCLLSQKSKISGVSYEIYKVMNTQQKIKQRKCSTLLTMFSASLLVSCYSVVTGNLLLIQILSTFNSL